MKTFLKYLFFYIAIAFLAIIIGIIGWSFLFIVNNIIHFLWIGHEDNLGILYIHPFVIPIFIILGSLFLAFIYTKVGVIPKPGITYAKEYKIHKRVKYEALAIVYFLAMGPLILGSSVGPEAALIGIFFMLSSFIGDVTLFIEKRLNIQTLKNEHDKFFDNLKYNKFYLIKIIVLYTVTTIVLLKLSSLDKFPPFNVKLPTATITIKEIIFIIPLIMCGIGLGLFYKKSEHLIEKQFKKINNLYIKNLITGIILSIFALTLPILILSGEATLHILVENPIKFSGIVLIIFALLKIILTNICISGNLRGGHIFPIIFASFLLGTGLGIIFNINLTFSITFITCAATLTIFSNIFAVFLLLALFFPIKLLLIIFIVTLIMRERISADNNNTEL